MKDAIKTLLLIFGSFVILATFIFVAGTLVLLPYILWNEPLNKFAGNYPTLSNILGFLLLVIIFIFYTIQDRISDFAAYKGRLEILEDKINKSKNTK